MSDLQLRYLITTNPGWEKEVIRGTHVIVCSQPPVIKRHGWPGWVGYCGESEQPTDLHPESVVMVNPQGHTMTYSKYRSMSRDILQFHIRIEKYRYIDTFTCLVNMYDK